MGDMLDFASLRDDAVAVVEKSISSLLGGKSYRGSKVADWANAVSEAAIKDLRGLSEDFKYIVTCCIKQNTAGGGLRSASAAFWDGSTDGSATVRWNNKSMVAVVTVFATLL
uniref:Dynein light chain n=1 Tax=Bicosoecida sp. CB-2014 TaxID=1486930 RepID=A0A7S1GEF6_9STRA|mmetsp:Transcript_763/g.2288  ORF Transcript_763/g.2288 Transcript_763/m.2288 type:complete len:112 (+) Transcript_763:219-554(+)